MQYCTYTKTMALVAFLSGRLSVQWGSGTGFEVVQRTAALGPWWVEW